MKIQPNTHDEYDKYNEEYEADEHDDQIKASKLCANICFYCDDLG